MGVRVARGSWDAIVVEAAGIVRSYDTGVTFRQLFYRLVSRELIPNRQSAYSRLSELTAKARREGWFPDLIDNTRMIRRESSWDGAKDAMEAITSQYRRDRTEGQDYSIYIAIEKNALAALLVSWFEEKGLPVLAMGGYPSQTFVDGIKHDIDAQRRGAVLIYAGDFDASGEDILRDFENRTRGYWDSIERIALNQEQIDEYELPGKTTDARAQAFMDKHGALVQVELDALPPDVLKKLYEDAVDSYWEDEPFEASLKVEEKDKRQLLFPDDTKELVDALREASAVAEDYAPRLADRCDEILDKYDGVF